MLSLEKLERHYTVLNRTMKSFKKSKPEYFKIMVDMVDDFARDVELQYANRTVSLIDPVLNGCIGYIYNIKRTIKHNKLQITIKFNTGHKRCTAKDIIMVENDYYFQRR